MPANPGLHQKIVLLRPVSTYLRKRNVQALGADASSLRQHFVEIIFIKSEAAECRERGLLSTESCDGVDARWCMDVLPVGVPGHLSNPWLFMRVQSDRSGGGL
jgi:hypothetical protein